MKTQQYNLQSMQKNIVIMIQHMCTRTKYFNVQYMKRLIKVQNNNLILLIIHIFSISDKFNTP